MKKIFYLLMALIWALCACDKDKTIDHNIWAEFPKQESLEALTLLVAPTGNADILLTSNGVVSSLEGLETGMAGTATWVRYKSLAVVYGASDDLEELLEATFWQAPSLQWVYILSGTDSPAVLESCGFVNCLRARGLSSEDTYLYVGSQVYDKISSVDDSPLGFTVQVKEVDL